MRPLYEILYQVAVVDFVGEAFQRDGGHGKLIDKPLTITQNEAVVKRFYLIFFFFASIFSEIESSS